MPENEDKYCYLIGLFKNANHVLIGLPYNTCRCFKKIELEELNRMQDLDNADSISESTINTESTTDFGILDDNEDDYADDIDGIEVPQHEIDQIVSSRSEMKSELHRELLGYHYKLKHLQLFSLQRLAQQGMIPKRLAKVKPPLCVACQIRKQTRKP